MAVIGRRAALAALLCALAGVTIRADEASELRGRLSDLANALSGGNPSEAIALFSKSSKDYEKLRNYFSGLTNAFTITNEVEVLSEPDEPDTPPVLNVRWALTLTDPATQFTKHRSAEVRIRFVREKNKWKIAEFTPIELFDPAAQS